MRDILYTVGTILIALVCISPLVLVLVSVAGFKIFAGTMLLLSIIFVAAYGVWMLIDLFKRF